MNYLAHAYLSFNHPDILTGNMISDFVKGKKKFEYATGIQKGMVLHRAIDDFTDTHPATQEAKQFFRPQYRLYAGAFIDVVYDHFLATDTNQFPTEENLLQFSESTYNKLYDHFEVLPERFQKMLPFMKTQNWLYNYQFTDGIEKSFGGLVRRAAYLTESAIAFEIFNTHYDELKKFYNAFFPELKNFAVHHLQQLSKND
ncbi:ACP phosphodiesterase [Ferruginibacter sp. SUN002]|uniref:acyl carrier protein phosphodiesterase n=1 Tax=Ferruginibacter sp. SUN002 TaxID=2937789 RepID=UPI003D368C69